MLEMVVDRLRCSRSIKANFFMKGDIGMLFIKIFHRYLPAIFWVLFLSSSAYGASAQSVGEQELDYVMSITVDFLILHGEDQERIAEVLDSQLSSAEKLDLLFVLTSKLYQSEEDQRFVWVSLLSEFEHYEVTGPIWDAVKEFFKEDVLEPLTDKLRETLTSDDDSGVTTTIHGLECGDKGSLLAKTKIECEGVIEKQKCSISTEISMTGCDAESIDRHVREPSLPSTLDDVPLGPVPPPFPSQPDSGSDGSSHEDVIRNELMNHPSAF